MRSLHTGESNVQRLAQLLRGLAREITIERLRGVDKSCVKAARSDEGYLISSSTHLTPASPNRKSLHTVHEVSEEGESHEGR